MSEVRILTPNTHSGLREVWRFRALLRSLVMREMKVKYKRSSLGFIWTLLNPLIISIILIAVFSHVIRIQIDNYWAFLLSGYFVWNFIQLSLGNSTYVLRENAGLRRSVAFPSEILILSASILKLIEFLIAIVLVLAVLLLFHHQSIPVSLVLFPLLIIIQLFLVVGLMYPIAVISVLFYDFGHAFSIVIMGFFYISPVFYPVEMVPEAVRPYYLLLNPFAGILTLYHDILYQGQWPSMVLLGSVSASAVVIYLIGYAIFNRYKSLCIEIA